MAPPVPAGSTRVDVAMLGVRASETGSVNTTRLQAAFDSFAGSGFELILSEPIQLAGTVNWRAGVSLRGEAAASITASNPMGAVFQSPLNELVEDCHAVGLPIYCASKANTAFDLQCFRNFLLEQVRIEDWLTDAVIAGNSSATQTSYELRALHVWTHRRTTVPPAGSRGLYLRYATDNKINHARIVGAEVGVQADSGANFYGDVHCWVRVGLGLMKKGFVSTANAWGQYYSNCYADTPSEHGWYLDGKNHTITNGRVYNNGAVADNTAIGAQFLNADPRSSVIGFVVDAVDSSHRIARDIAYTGFPALASLTILGNQANNCVTQENQNVPNLHAHTQLTGEAGLVSSGSAGAATRRTILATDGVLRFDLGLSTAAESGANAGSNGQIRRYSDAGALLGTPIDINRATGAVSCTDNSFAVSGTWDKPLWIGPIAMWANATSGKFYKKNGTPTSDTDGIVVGTEA